GGSTPGSDSGGLSAWRVCRHETAPAGGVAVSRTCGSGQADRARGGPGDGVSGNVRDEGRMVNDSGSVMLGSWVTVKDRELQEAWRVVDPAEADAARRLISADCPLGRALLGHRAGDQVRVDSPGGRWPVTILAVE